MPNKASVYTNRTNSWCMEILPKEDFLNKKFSTSCDSFCAIMRLSATSNMEAV